MNLDGGDADAFAAKQETLRGPLDAVRFPPDGGSELEEG